MKSIGAAIVLGMLGAASALHAQSLTDVAKAEQARRKGVSQPAKVYTNEDLKSPEQAAASSQTAAPAPAGSAAGPDAAKAAAADAAKKDEAAKKDTEPAKDEKYWKERMAAAQNALTHDKVLADALQSRINALTNDFASTSDPAQRAVVEQNRKTALAEMDRINADMTKQTKAVTEIQEEARKANVPPGWLR